MIATTAGTLPRSATVPRRRAVPTSRPGRVRPRRPDEPDDLTALAHDALRDDARRLADLVRGLVLGTATVDAGRAGALGASLDRLCHHLAPLLSSGDALLVADLRVAAAAATRALQSRPLALATREDSARLARCSALLDLVVTVLADAELAVPDPAVAWRRAAETAREPVGLGRRGRLRLQLLRGRARRDQRAVLG